MKSHVDGVQSGIRSVIKRRQSGGKELSAILLMMRLLIKCVNQNPTISGNVLEYLQ